MKNKINDLHYGNTTYKEMTNFNPVRNWAPCEELLSQYKNSDYAVIILNTPINFNQHFILNLWNQAKVRITVDGGTKKWFQWLTSHEREFKEALHPDLITGDMDSLPKDVLNYFEKRNSKIVVTPDQDETDFTKALRELKTHCNMENLQIDTVYALADTSGRFDQIMANINTLYKSRDILKNVKIYQVASSSLTWLLSKGQHSISIPATLRKNQEWCALIPVGSPCVVSSTGLKWNLVNTKLEFGFLVSTSNTYDGSPEITVETDGPIVWSMGIETLLS
ncbi:thiamin pyrophosphokinase 1 [Anoplophora glabripennis]|uniref:thiamin pyrophosphokinase 1 n=1 Tax=Anoplophora glabripennis TaxID=217634 RepID=UPI00087501B5|nr:thiamin pyrophosphokinase 1 [Anoplophora glabripennis]